MDRLTTFLVSPIPAALLGALVSWSTNGHPRPVSVAVFYLLQLYVLQLVFGLAIFAWVKRSGRVSLLSHALAGFFMVAVVAVPYLIWASGRSGNTAERSVLVLVIWLTLGAVTGATAWAIERNRQSKLDAAA